MDDEGYEWFPAMNRALNLVRDLNIPVIVANSDLVYPVREGRVSLGIGALAHMLEAAAGKSFIHCGKPDSMMFSYAFACAHANNDRLTKADVLMVGDTLRTDFFGGNKFGVDTALVLTGNTRLESVQGQIDATGISPTYICSSVLS
jgi:HAD superfamily hydrolase (TIGR01450 family)